VDEISSEQLQIFQAMEARIKRRYARRIEFISHAIAFVILVPIIWLVILNWLPDYPFWKIVGAISTGGWAVGFLIHLVQVIGQEMEDRAIMGEMERLGMLGSYKRKRDEQSPPERLVRLSDDGEIIDLGLEMEEERKTYYD
jgi:hypothetical protein